MGSASGTDAERQVLDALERDATREAGMSVVDLVASYFDETRDERRGVSRGTHPAELSRRFDEAWQHAADEAESATRFELH